MSGLDIAFRHPDVSLLDGTFSKRYLFYAERDRFPVRCRSTASRCAT
jgi:hypothetical protein